MCRLAWICETEIRAVITCRRVRIQLYDNKATAVEFEWEGAAGDCHRQRRGIDERTEGEWAADERGGRSQGREAFSIDKANNKNWSN